MLRRLRNKLRLIRYYSAPRRETAWTRAQDIALVASLLLALPVAWMCDVSIARPREVFTLRGSLWLRDDSQLTAILLDENGRPTRSASGRLQGNFTLTVVDNHHGWPLTTTVRRQPARLSLDLFNQSAPQENVQLAGDSPIRAAIEKTLTDEGEAEAMAAWRLSSPAAKHHWLSWAAGAAAWWVGLALSALALIALARIGSILVGGKAMQRRALRRAEGHCVICGYDLRGLEFTERCPECGELVW